MERFSHINPFESHFLKNHEVRPHQMKELAKKIETQQFLFFPVSPSLMGLNIKVESCEIEQGENLAEIKYAMRLRDNYGTELCFSQESKSKFAFSVSINSIWPVAEQMLDFYFEDFGIDKLWKAYLLEKTENPDTAPMYPDQEKGFTSVDKDALRMFIDKLSFLIAKVLTRVRNTNGFSWRLANNDKERFQSCYISNQQSLHVFRLQRRRVKKQVTCSIESEPGALLAHIGCEKIISNPDVRGENLKFYQHFGNMNLISNPKANKSFKKSASIELKQEQQREKEIKFINMFQMDSKTTNKESMKSKNIIFFNDSCE